MRLWHLPERNGRVGVRSLELRVTIEPLSEADDAVTTLSHTIASMGTAELTAALEVNVSVVTSAAAEQVEREYEATCPKGFWCSAGNTIACPVNTYNNETGSGCGGRTQRAAAMKMVWALGWVGWCISDLTCDLRATQRGRARTRAACPCAQSAMLFLVGSGSFGVFVPFACPNLPNFQKSCQR